MRAKILWLMVPFLLAAGSPAFAAQFYITATANIGGKVSPPLVKGKNPVAEGADLSVTFQANDGYYLAEVKVDKVAVPLAGRKTFIYPFTNVTKNHTIAARFTRDPFVTASSTAGGTIDPKGKVFVPYSTSQTFSIQPSTGFYLRDLLVDGVSRGNELTSWTFDFVKVKHSLRAFFAINTYTVTLVASPGGNIAPAMTTAKHGQTKIFTVIPVKGMKIMGVTVNGAPRTGFPTDGRPYQFPLTITANVTITADFAELVTAGSQRLKGTYRIVSRESSFWQNNGGNTYVGDNMSANNITASFDGNGGCNIALTGKEFHPTSDGNGNQTVVASPNNEAPNSCSYVVTDAGVFTLTLGTPDGTETVTGWASTDGNVMITGGASQYIDQGGNGTGYNVETITGVKAGSILNKSSVSGTYHLVSQEETFWQSANGGQTHVSDNLHGNIITANFDGNGGCDINATGTDYSINGDGNGNEYVNVSTYTDTITDCAYTITPAGVFTLTLVTSDGTETITGWASADGNAVNFGGPSQKSDPNGTGYSTEHIFGVKAGAGMTNSSLSGSYRIVGSDLGFWQSTDGNNTHVSKNLYGNNVIATFDGVGGCAISYTGEGYHVYSDNAGNQTVNVSADSGSATSCSYSMGADGTFTLNLVFPDGGDTVTGWASADGNSMVIGGPEQKSEPGGTGYRVELMVGTKVQ